MHKRAFLALMLGLGLGADEPEKPERELFVPFEDLHFLLNNPEEQRVLISRAEFETLKAQAKREEETRAPHGALLSGASYRITIADERAHITGEVGIDVLEAGVHALRLDIGGVGLQAVQLDKQAAPIGRDAKGHLQLMVEGLGQHTLQLEAIASIETTAARQILGFRLPMPGATTLTLTIPGDVEVKSGAAVIERVFDEAQGETRFTLLARRDLVNLVMSLNSRLKRTERAVIAQSVLVDEVTTAYERLHATISLDVLHRAVADFRFRLPPGLEITDVQSENLSRWEITEAEGERLLEILLRDEASGRVILHVSSIRMNPDLDNWTMPQIEPLDVIGHVAVIGMLAEESLKLRKIATEQLVSIDSTVLMQAIPQSFLTPDPGAAQVRALKAFYAPQRAFGLTGQFYRPASRLYATGNVTLSIQEQGLRVEGGFVLVPVQDKLFDASFSVPAGWDVQSVTDEHDQALVFERFGSSEEAGRVLVRLPQAVAANEESRIFFTARHVPAGWFSEWASKEVRFPVFAIQDAARDIGAIAVDASDTLDLRATELAGLTPLDQNEKARYGMRESNAALAFRYESSGYAATITADQVDPRVTAETYSFFTVNRESLRAHYEIIYNIEKSKLDSVQLVLPARTPSSLSIYGLGGTGVKEFFQETTGSNRIWTVSLNQSADDRVHVAVDFLMPVDKDELQLPIVEAAGVAYQSGLLSVEGSPELDVEITHHPRPVDVGELISAAEYLPGRRLLGAFGYVGTPEPVRIKINEPSGYLLPPALVERAEISTSLSTSGRSQSAARFHIRSNADFLEVKLPGASELWSVMLNGKAAKPQQEAERLLLELPSGRANILRDLQIVYETPVAPLDFRGRIQLQAPRLFLHERAGLPAREVPVTDLKWRVYVPDGYDIIHTRGNVVTEYIEPPQSAAVKVSEALYAISGGVNPRNGMVGLVLMPFRSMAEATRSSKGYKYSSEPQDMADDFGGVDMSTFETAANQEVPETEEMERVLVPAAKPVPTAAPPEPASAAAPPARNDTALAQVKKEADMILPSIPAKASIEKGRSIFMGMGSCFSCHGPTGKGDGPAAIALNPKPRSFAEGAFLYDTDKDGQKGTRADLKNILANGTFKYGGSPLMPPRPDIQGADLEDLLDYVISLGPAKTKVSGKDWARKGLSSLKIDLASAGQAVEFKSLGEQPELDVKMIHVKRRGALVWAIAIAVFLAGTTQSRASWKRRFSFISLVLIVVSALPALPLFLGWVPVLNGMFYAACALIPFYLLAGCWLKIWGGIQRWGLAADATIIYLLVGGLGFLLAGDTLAQEKSAVPYIPVPQPITVPADAIVVPFNPVDGFEPAATKLLVPYTRYERLYKQAHPEEEQRTPPAAYAIAGADYRTRLEGDDFLLVDGRVEIDVYTDGYVEIPFHLEDGVFTKALLDGQAARLHAAVPQLKPQGQNPPAEPRTMLVVSGKGHHVFEAAIRMKVAKQGGWRRVSGRLPHAPASLLTLSVPGKGTEVNLRNVPDRPLYKTLRADEDIRSTLGAKGQLDLQWRPRISEGDVDRTLTVISQALFDIQEDHHQLTWDLQFKFRRVEREFFEVHVPSDYLVQKVEGLNVRGWERENRDGRQHLKIRLLKRVKEHEAFTVHLRKEGSEAEPFLTPVVVVPDAIRHTGKLLIRRSPFMGVRTVASSGVNRNDLDPGRDTALIKRVKDESPLGIKPYESYTFNTVPFELELALQAVDPRVTATFKTILRMGLREKNIECRLDLHIQDRPLHQFRVALPADLELENVSAPGTIEWEVSDQVLTLHFASGAINNVPILLIGKHGSLEEQPRASLPVFKALDVQRQDGYLVIQSDPGYDVETADLENVEHSLMSRVHGWLLGPQRTLTRAALFYTTPDYAGTVTLNKRTANVNGYTISNARITDRTIEETLLLHFNIEKAGIREVKFRLPRYLADAEISVPFLREKTLAPAEGFPGELLVTLTLQDEVMNQLRVLIEHDRVLTGATYQVAIPTVLTGRVDRQYVARESAGRDEVLTHDQSGLEPLTRQMKEWSTVNNLLTGGTTEAWIVTPGAEKPHLTLATKQRKKVETAGATIGLSQTLLIMDAAGTYRARQTYQVDNRTEQFLAIELPEGATLWTARVANEYVKPIQPDAKNLREVRIPLVKTAEGDIDYEVVLKYGGKVKKVRTLSQINFPLIKTSRIHVELSQVELRLPNTHSWHNFDGTLRRELVEGQFEAGQLGYLNKQAKKLVQVLQYGDDFSKARAYANLKVVQKKVRDNRQATEHFSRNRDWGVAAQAADAILNQADEELKKVDEQAPTIDLAGNRVDFNGQFDLQTAMCSANMVNNYGWNFSISDIVDALPATNLVNFSKNWLLKSGLDNDTVDRNATVVGGRLINPNVQVQMDNQALELKKNAYYLNNLSLGITKVKQSEGREQAMKQQQGKKITSRRGQQAAASRYQSKLDAFNAPAQQSVVSQIATGAVNTENGVAGIVLNSSGSIPHTINISGGLQAGNDGLGFGIGGGSAGGAISLYTIPGPINDGRAVGTGLASLDVQLPDADDSRWTSYRFTTPRGDIQISSRPASKHAIGGLKRVGIVLVILLMLSVLQVILHDRSLDHKGRKILSTTLILLGVAGLLVGILPVFAFVSIVAGIVMKVGQRRAATRRALQGA